MKVVYLLFLLFSISFCLNSTNVNCLLPGPGSSLCTQCNSNASYLLLNSNDTTGSACSTTCNASVGFVRDLQTNGLRCYIDKQCPPNIYALRRSDGADTTITCNATCPVTVGYQGFNGSLLNCYVGIFTLICSIIDFKCPKALPFLLANLAGNDATLSCSATCNTSQGYQDSNNASACYTGNY